MANKYSRRDWESFSIQCDKTIVQIQKNVWYKKMSLHDAMFCKESERTEMDKAYNHSFQRIGLKYQSIKLVNG